MTEIDPQLLLRAAARARTEPTLLGATLADYAARRGFDDAALAAELGCDQLQLARLMLCRPPRAGRFADDLRQIAGRIGLEPLALARILRLADALAALANASRRDEGLRAARRAEDAEDADAQGDEREEPE